MDWSDRQAELFWRVANDNNNLQYDEMARQYGHRMLECLDEAGFEIEFPPQIEYRVALKPKSVGAVGNDVWDLWKYTDTRGEWLASFKHKHHAQDMADLLTNDLPQINLRS